MPPSASSTEFTPLAPSVEKAYYRKCIQLKRRLNEVETANDEMKLRRIRLDRSVEKMRLERAFILDQLSRRMEYNVDGSEGSADEGMTTPPPDRPHRDKRRRPTTGSGPGPQSSHAHHAPTYANPQQDVPQQNPPPVVPGPNGVMVPANAVSANGQYMFVPPEELAMIRQQQHQREQQAFAGQSAYPSAGPPLPLPHGSPYGAPVGVPGATAAVHENGAEYEGTNERDRERDAQPEINRAEGAVGEAVTAGPAIREDANGERRIMPAGAAPEVDTDRQDQAGGFTALNQASAESSTRPVSQLVASESVQSRPRNTSSSMLNVDQEASEREGLSPSITAKGASLRTEMVKVSPKLRSGDQPVSHGSRAENVATQSSPAAERASLATEMGRTSPSAQSTPRTEPHASHGPNVVDQSPAGAKDALPGTEVVKSSPKKPPSSHRRAGSSSTDQRKPSSAQASPVRAAAGAPLGSGMAVVDAENVQISPRRAGSKITKRS